MENALISTQAANTNHIRKLEKQVAATTAKLKKVEQWQPPPPGICNNQHQNHGFFHRIRIRSTHLCISGNFQRVLR
jgi:hypothetical protein